MDLWGTDIHSILEQDGGSPWRAWRNCVVRGYHNDHSFYAGRLGSIRRRLSRNDRESRLLDEGLRPACRVFLFAEAGLIETFTGPLPRDCFYSHSHNRNTFWGRQKDRLRDRVILIQFLTTDIDMKKLTGKVA